MASAHTEKNERMVMDMKSEYKIVPPEGKAVHIVAKTRDQAIKEYHRITWTSMEFIKKHCVIKNLGRVE